MSDGKKQLRSQAWFEMGAYYRSFLKNRGFLPPS